LQVNGVFEQRGGMNFDGAATGGGLPDKFRLHFWPDVNGNGHAKPPKFHRNSASIRSQQNSAI
jgi:hypothetical protein